MQVENFIRSQVNSGYEATVSIALLEHLMGDYFFGSRLKQWVDSFAKELGVKATIHFSSDAVTFYPRTQP